MNITLKTASALVLASLMFAPAATAQTGASKLKDTTTTMQANGTKIIKGTDMWGNSVKRTVYPRTYSYDFAMDCFHSSVSGALSDTNDAVSVKFHMKNGKVLTAKQSSVFSRELSAPNCTRISDAIYSVENLKSTLPINTVKTSISGSDELWMDFTKLIETTVVTWKDAVTSSNGIITLSDSETRKYKKTIKTWGQDGGKGYCLSTDANDAARFGNSVSHCKPSLTFNAVTGGVTGPRAKVTTKAYALAIKTADKRRAGTDSNIHIKLNGASGVVGGSTGILLNPKLSGNAFERGDLDQLRLSGLPDVGRIRSVTLKSDGRHPGADWVVAYVKVNGVQFNCGNKEIEGAGQITCG